MVNISNTAVYSFINYLHILGINRIHCLNLIGLTEQQLNQQKLVDITHYQTLYSHAIDVLNINNLGFQSGQHMHTDRWGILGQIVFTSPTIEVALANQRRYQSIAGSLGTPSYTVENNQVTLKWIPAIKDSSQLAEELITSWIEFARRLTSQQTHPLQVFFSHSCLTTITEYQDYFNCPVTFEHNFTGIIIDASLLKKASSGVNLELNKTLTKYADWLLTEHSIQNPIEVATDFIATQLPHNKPSLQSLSIYLNTSERTLQRRFRELGSNFSELVDKVKQDIAINYLNHSQLSLNAIAELLGFSELSAFNRAFKRWQNTSPAKFRKAIKEN